MSDQYQLTTISKLQLRIEALEKQLAEPNIRLLAAIFYLYCMKNREGWEEGPAAEECWSRVCDEVANTLGVGFDVEAAGEWLAERDEMIRRAKPWER